MRERLSRLFSADEVFMDVTGIRGGEQWQQVLDRQLDWADAVVVLIGERWLGSTNERGRRLDQADDPVRWEITEALRRGKRVVPLRIEGAPFLAADELPEPLKPLAELQALPLSNLRFEKDIETLFETLSGERMALARILELRWLAWRAAYLVPSIALAALFAAWVGLLDLLRLDSLVANTTMLAGDWLAPNQPSQKLALVALEPDEQALAEGSSRKQKADLIRTLSALRAKRIVFDVYFSPRSTPYDAGLLQAVRETESRGTEVVFGFNALRGGKPLAFPGLTEAASSLGNVCVASRLGWVTLGFLAVQHAAGDILPALPLTAVCGKVTIHEIRRDIGEVALRDPCGDLRPRYTLLQRVGEGRSRCPALAEGDTGAAILFPISRKERLRATSYQFAVADVLHMAPDSENRFAGKIVLVGVRHPQDKIVTRMDLGSARYGFELHADAISALLERQTVRVVPPWGQWALMLLMAAGAVGLRAWRRGRKDRWRGFLAVAALAVCFGAAVLAYTEARVLINALYQMLAFLLTYWLFGLLQRRLERV